MTTSASSGDGDAQRNGHHALPSGGLLQQHAQKLHGGVEPNAAAGDRRRWERQQQGKRHRPVRAERGGGQTGDRRAEPRVSRRSGGEPDRAAGDVHDAEEAVAHAPVHETPEPGGPGGGFLPGAAAALLGDHLPLLRARLSVPDREAPAGAGHVRVHVHDGDDGLGPLHRHLSPAADAPAAVAARAHHDRVHVGVQPGPQLPAVLHLLPERGAARLGSLRLLGPLRGAVGAARVHHLDHGRHLPGAGARAGVVLRSHLPRDLEEPQIQEPMEERGSQEGAAEPDLGPQRQRHLPRQITHGEDDVRDRGGVRGVLGAFLHRADVVSVGPNLLLAR